MASFPPPVASLFHRLPPDSRLTFSSLARFARLAGLAKPFIRMQLTPQESSLPDPVRATLAGAMEWEAALVDAVWAVMHQEIWAESSQEGSEVEVHLYNRFALEQGTSYQHMFPPTRICLSPLCSQDSTTGKKTLLGEPRTHKATLFTLRYGPLPIYTTSLYCRKCKTRYHVNNYIHNSQRIYYHGVPDVLQVAQHFFIEAALLELFVAGQVFGWISATNWARIYNYAIAPRCPHIVNNKLAFSDTYSSFFQPRYPGWQSTFSLRPEDVLNGFFLYSLLLDKAEHGWTLSIPHCESSQTDRLRSTLHERNQAMEGVGQEAYPHACDLCFHVLEKDGAPYKIQAAVCDGNNMGHPCCGVHDCKIPLQTRTDRFCPSHKSREKKCAIDNCEVDIAGRHQTCEDPDHRRLEDRYFSSGTSLFQLRSRLKRAGVVVPDDSATLVSSSSDDPGVVEDDACEEKPDTVGYSKRKLRACFGTNYTHTELLFMRPCGVILSRATLYGSEAISAVHLAALATFPTVESTPEYLFYDSNCKLTAHQNYIRDHHFDQTAQPVDVFHFRTKHKESDVFCQQHCNPAAFSELIQSDGQWRFNTSICEQTNVWLGGYIAILRNMEVTRYNFYLDEMIKRRNRYMIHELAAKGRSPWMVPIDTLFRRSSDIIMS